jgi:hypothetical protein
MVSALGVSGSPWPQLHSVYVTSSQQPGLACSPSNFGVGFSRASGLRPEAWLIFLGSREELKLTQACLGFESRFLGCPPGLRPFRCWLELCIPCLALGSLMILVHRFILDIERRATFLRFVSILSLKLKLKKGVVDSLR